MTTAKAPPRYRRYPGDARRAMLIEAGMACLQRGGIRDFTVDLIAAEAKVSRGLIAHHFGSKDGLLAAVYSEMYARLLVRLDPDARSADVGRLIHLLADEHLLQDANLQAWLALWGEVATNATLQAAHRRHYVAYRTMVAGVIRRAAAQRGRIVDADRLALMLIALIDGLWLERGIDPGMLGGAEAREACFQLAESFLGPIERQAPDSGNEPEPMAGAPGPPEGDVSG